MSIAVLVTKPKREKQPQHSSLGERWMNVVRLFEGILFNQEKHEVVINVRMSNFQTKSNLWGASRIFTKSLNRQSQRKVDWSGQVLGVEGWAVTANGDEVLFGVVIGSSVFPRGLCAVGWCSVWDTIGKWDLMEGRSLAECTERGYWDPALLCILKTMAWEVSTTTCPLQPLWKPSGPSSTSSS